MPQVLVVEKDPTLARLYHDELQDAGFEVQVMYHLEEALLWMEARRVDVLVTDESSCGHGYNWWLPRVRRVHEGPVVMLSPPGQAKAHEKGLSMLPKTSDLRPLIRSVRAQVLGSLWGPPTTPSC